MRFKRSQTGQTVTLLARLVLATFLTLAAPSLFAQTEAPKQDTSSPSVKSPPAARPQSVAQPNGTSAVVMDLSAIESVIGKGVKSSNGEDLGRVVDLLVTTSGQVRAAVIDFGGILGVGSRKVAVDWKALDFGSFAKDGTVHLALTRNQVRMSPEFKSGEPVVILQAGKPEEQKSPQAKQEQVGPGQNKAEPNKVGTPPPGQMKPETGKQTTPAPARKADEKTLEIEDGHTKDREIKK